MSKVHHVEDRSIEHAKTRDSMAHKLISPGAPDGGYRSTRGFAAVKGSQPAVDIQPRHGGKAKGGTVNHSWGNTPAQIAKENTAHVVTTPADALSANPLDLMTSSQAGKRLAPAKPHDGMTKDQIGNAMLDGDGVLAEAGLPKQVTAEDCK